MTPFSSPSGRNFLYLPLKHHPGRPTIHHLGSLFSEGIGLGATGHDWEPRLRGVARL